MLALVFSTPSVRQCIVDITVFVILPVASWLPFFPKMLCIIGHL